MSFGEIPVSLLKKEVTEMIRPFVLFAFLACSMTNLKISIAQETSVKPGINDSFQNPNPDEFVERFEIESREVFHKRQAIIEACRIEPGSTVADIGAGTGLFTRLLSKQVGDQGRVIAVDIAAKFLEHIRMTSESLGQQNVETVLCTANSTELPENSIDVAFICDTYHHFEFPLKTMTSLHRALKPGGRVILIDFQRIEGESSPWVLNHVRAGQAVVEIEIKQCGFRKASERQGLLQENYFVVFQKLQSPAELKSSIVAGVGEIAELTGAPAGPRPGGRLVFDVTASSKPGEINAGLERAARVLNLYGAEGLKAEDVRITIVLHGDAVMAALVDKSSQTPGAASNVNLPIIAELNRLGVDVMVCGQTLARKKHPHEDVAEGVIVATSAMTALMNRQADGFSLMRVQ